MSDIKLWSETAANNNLTSPNGFPEGMAPSGVNDSMREVMASVRRWTDGGGWHNWGHTYIYGSGTTFTVAIDVTAIYHANRRVRAVGSATGTIYGTISGSSYSSPNTTITVVWDSGTLSNETLVISVGFLAADNKTWPLQDLSSYGTKAGQQIQSYNSAAAGGTVDAITATFTPIIASLTDKLRVCVIAAGANITTTPTFAPDSLTAHTIVKGSNQALVAGDIPGADFPMDLEYNSNLTAWVLMNPAYAISVVPIVPVTSYPQYALIQDIKNSGTNGGTFTNGSWQIRALTNISVNEGSIVTSLSSNQFVLPAGTYRIKSKTPGYECGSHQAKLRNITDNSDTLIGSSELSNNSTGMITSSIICGEFTITGSKTFEIQHYSQYTGLFGVACNFSVNEIYTQVEIWKLP